MSMSISGGGTRTMFYMQNVQTGGQCSDERHEHEVRMNQESDEDNTSCSASEIGCDLTLSSNNNNDKSPQENNSSSSSRKNKRKNFKPRNILEYAGSDEDERPYHHNHHPIADEDQDQDQEGIEKGDVYNNHDESNESGDNSDDNSEEFREDGPLDLSDVQDYSNKSSPWSRKEKENDHQTTLTRNLLTNLNNNLDPSNFLNPLSFASMGMDLRMRSSSESNNNNNDHHGVHRHGMLNDFAENTMKELLSLYGIGGGQLKGGKTVADYLDTPPGHQSKVATLPENMARLLAAMQESVQNQGDNTSTSSTSSITTHNSKGGQTQTQSHSLNFANINSLSSSPQRHQHQLNGTSPTLFGPGNGHLTFPQKHKSRGLASFPVIREGLLGKGAGPIDYTRYVRRYGNSIECGYQQCRDHNYREHFHCQECSDGTRVFVKKEEMIRHFKWHKKRDESLQHGFMRYSPTDDCSDKFPNCSHNGKQTHYHCLKDGCEKVYISTSDVQMHANYHRKDSAIIQEGFQRFRAAEDCGSDQCSFRHQKTTHFHCRRPTCSFTFKNKADMEKHKSYHIKDEQLNRDGFKKFMKHEECQYPSCRFSRVCNHIHCIREGCNYVLHSSGQLYSHKRKHERRDAELAYRKYKLAQSLMKGSLLPGDLELSKISEDDNNSHSSFNDGISSIEDSEERMKKTLQICTCDVSSQEHFHCKVETCRNLMLSSFDIASEHVKNHEMEDKISSIAYFGVDPANFDAQDSTIPCISAKCPYQTREKHYHCLWDSCNEIILPSDEPFKRLEHFRSHQLTPKSSSSMDFNTSKDEEESNMDGFFRRKRGRPPKNRVIEVSSGTNEAIYTSFKLPKATGGHNSSGNGESSTLDPKDHVVLMSYPEGVGCNNEACPYQNQRECHYHCGHARCFFSSKGVQKLSLHLREFHGGCDIIEGFKYFEKSWDCGVPRCTLNGEKDHFHCLRDKYTCISQGEMMGHENDEHDIKSDEQSSEEDEEQKDMESKGGGNVMKSSGIFYPTYSLDKSKLTTNGGSAMDLSGSNGLFEQNDVKPITDHSLSRILQIPSSSSPDNGETQYGPEIACGRPFCKLKRKHHFHCHLCNQAFSELEKLRPHVLKHSSGISPMKQGESEHSTDEESFTKNDEDNHQDQPNFPKLQRSEDQGQAPGSHHPSSFPKFDLGPSSNPFPPTSLSNFLGYHPGVGASPYLFLQHNPLTSLYAGMMFGGGSPSSVFPHGIPPPPPSAPPPTSASSTASILPTSEPSLTLPLPLPLPLPSSNSNGPLKRPPSASPSSSPSSPSDAKKARMQMRILKDEPVPEGYIRFRFNEDCQYIHCGYREHQTHFHCTREDCGYSFCDKTRFVQHTARHERLDTLMGGDFKQFRANVACGRPDCAYKTPPGTTQAQNKASHFHCSKCDFVCTDTNKVVAHRRQHQKLDSIMAAGFEKFTPSQNCQIETCIHSQKQTHYHCLKCGYAVLGLSQMSAHKYRHVD